MQMQKLLCDKRYIIVNNLSHLFQFNREACKENSKEVSEKENMACCAVTET